MNRDVERFRNSVRQLLELQPFGLITDVDGTISPLAATPGEAVVTEINKENLRYLAGHGVLVAVVSGRSAKKTKSMVGLENVIYFGNHGLERLDNHSLYYPPELEGFSAVIERITNELSPALRNIPGLVVEDKGLGIAIHYRLSPNILEAREAIIAAVRGVSDFQCIQVREGKMVVEIRPLVDITKGTALTQTISTYGLKSVIYLGDDNTDIDAMTALRRLRTQGKCEGMAVVVAGKDTPQRLLNTADYVLAGVGEVEKFLEWLATEFAMREVGDPQIDGTTRR